MSLQMPATDRNKEKYTPKETASDWSWGWVAAKIGGTVLIVGGTALVVWTYVEDVATFGVGIADDAPTTAAGIWTISNGLKMVGGGQAQITPLACDPTMLFMAAALANIDKKLDAIQDMQKEMMDFLVQKEKSDLKGNLNFLFDVFNNYKYNWNNEMYKNSNHIKVLDIRQEAEKNCFLL